MKGNAYSFAKAVDQQIEALAPHDYLRRRGRGKLLREELYPISRLALHRKRPGLEVEVEAFEDDGPADAHICESGFIDQEFDVQVTSDYSYDESLRDELLATEGISWSAGDIRRDKHSGRVLASPGVVDHDEHFKRISESIVRLFRKKTAISYGPNSVLVISFDDMTLSGHYNWKNLMAFVEKEGGLSGSGFKWVYLFNIGTNELQCVA